MNNPQRTCIACKSIKDKRELIRIVRNKEGIIELDMTGRKNGRGAYICKDVKCFENLKKSRGLDRSFKLQISTSIYDKLIDELNSL
nr:YlxR family protein [uncultured Catonella sp.]